MEAIPCEFLTGWAWRSRCFSVRKHRGVQRKRKAQYEPMQIVKVFGFVLQAFQLRAWGSCEVRGPKLPGLGESSFTTWQSALTYHGVAVSRRLEDPARSAKPSGVWSSEFWACCSSGLGRPCASSLCSFGVGSPSLLSIEADAAPESHCSETGGREAPEPRETAPPAEEDCQRPSTENPDRSRSPDLVGVCQSLKSPLKRVDM